MKLGWWYWGTVYKNCKQDQSSNCSTIIKNDMSNEIKLTFCKRTLKWENREE